MSGRESADRRSQITDRRSQIADRRLLNHGPPGGGDDGLGGDAEFFEGLLLGARGPEGGHADEFPLRADVFMPAEFDRGFDADIVFLIYNMDLKFLY